MILITTDSFKGSLTSPQACKIIAKAIRPYLKNENIIIKPIGDGGEGTAAAMITAANGQWVKRKVTGPLKSMQVKAGFGWFEKDKTAMVEMASASGLTLLDKNQLNPLITTTYGTGELIRSAIDYGAKRILLGVGGSATVDGGTGAAQALGWRFYDADGRKIGIGGGNLDKIESIEPPAEKFNIKIEVLCDVDNILCGEFGAAAVYGPQKGANPEAVAILTKGLENLAKKTYEQIGINIAEIHGGGAAGGLAAGAAAFMNAELTSGIETVMDYLNIYENISNARWVITGEGSFDEQSLRGKVVCGIAKSALSARINVCVFAGKVELKPEIYNKYGITCAYNCMEKGMSTDYAIQNAAELLDLRVKEFAETRLLNPVR